MSKQPEGSEIIQGVVIEALANAMFRVQLDSAPTNRPQEDEENLEYICYLGGKMRVNRIRIIVGDRVEVLVDKYGGKPRIVRRL